MPDIASETVRGNPPVIETPPASTTVINRPSGPVDASTTQWMGPTWSKTLMGWGAVGFICAFFFFWWQVQHADEREDRKVNREAHEKVFEAMRHDAKEMQANDTEQRRKMTGAIREQTKILERMDANQLKMLDVLNKK